MTSLRQVTSRVNRVWPTARIYGCKLVGWFLVLVGVATKLQQIKMNKTGRGWVLDLS